MDIDEQKEFTPYRRKTENGQIVKTFSDHNTDIVKLKIPVRVQNGSDEKLIMNEKGHSRNK